MEKERHVKILSIVALVITIVGMSLGFAAFSVSLKIESSATVTPNGKDFHITIYGVSEGDTCLENGDARTCNYNNLSYSYIGGQNSGEKIIIDNNKSMISGFNFNGINLKKHPIYYENFVFLKIVNDGKYRVYFEPEGTVNYINGDIKKTCIALENTSQELVDLTCDYFYNYVYIEHFVDDQYEVSDKGYLDVGEHLIASLYIGIYARDIFADGPFEVKFDDIKIDYSTKEY